MYARCVHENVHRPEGGDKLADRTLIAHVEAMIEVSVAGRHISYVDSVSTRAEPVGNRSPDPAGATAYQRGPHSGCGPSSRIPMTSI